MMLVNKAMTRDVVAVAKDTSLDAVARLFVLRDISGAPVIEEDGHPIGVISQRDLLDGERPRSRTEGRAVYYRVWNGDVRMVGLLTDTPPSPGGVASDVMSPRLLTIDHEATVDDAARWMVAAHVHRLLVMNRGKIIGLISALDCLHALVDDGKLSNLRSMASEA